MIATLKARTATVTATSEWANATAIEVISGQTRSVVTSAEGVTIGSGGTERKVVDFVNSRTLLVHTAPPRWSTPHQDPLEAKIHFIEFIC